MNRWDWVMTVGPFVVIGLVALLGVLRFRRAMR